MSTGRNPGTTERPWNKAALAVMVGSLLVLVARRLILPSNAGDVLDMGFGEFLFRSIAWLIGAVTVVGLGIAAVKDPEVQSGEQQGRWFAIASIGFTVFSMLLYSLLTWHIFKHPMIP